MKYQTVVPHLDLFNSPAKRTKLLASPRISDHQPYFSPDLTSRHNFQSKTKPYLQSARSLQKYKAHNHEPAQREVIIKNRRVPMCQQKILYPSGYHLNIPFSTNYLDYEPEVIQNNQRYIREEQQYWSRAEKDLQEQRGKKIQQKKILNGNLAMQSYYAQNEGNLRILDERYKYENLNKNRNTNAHGNTNSNEYELNKIQRVEKQIEKLEDQKEGYTKTMSQAILDEIMKQQEVKKYQQKYNSENKFSQVIVGRIEKKTQLQTFKRYTQQQSSEEDIPNFNNLHQNTNINKNLQQSQENKEKRRQNFENSESDEWIINRSDIAQQQKKKAEIVNYNTKIKLKEDERDHYPQNQQIIPGKHNGITCNHERQMQRFLQFLEDDRSFRRKINEKNQEFNKIRIDLEESESFSISSLIRQKDSIVAQTQKYMSKIDHLLKQKSMKPKQPKIIQSSPSNTYQMPIQHKVISLQRLSPHPPLQLQKKVYQNQNWKPGRILQAAYVSSPMERSEGLTYHPIPTKITEHIIFQRSGS